MTTHYKIYQGTKEVYSGGTMYDCWKWLLHTYPTAITLAEVFEDGIEIRKAHDNA